MRLQVRANDLSIANLTKKGEERERDVAVMLGTINSTMKINADRMEEIRGKSAHELAEFKLTVAKEYATNTTLNAVKEEVVKAINQLSDRLYKQFDAQRRDGG